MHESNQQNNKIQCAIYARSATKNPSAITRQIANCKQIARERGWQIDDRDIFQDDGFSGSQTIGRPGLEQLQAAVQGQIRPINRILIEEVSRLGRDFQRIVEVLDVFTVHGVSVYAAETKLELGCPTNRQLLGDVMGMVDRVRSELGQQFKKL